MFQFEVDEPDSSHQDQNVPFAVGDRVRVSQQVGSVRYVGEVEGYSGLWLGLEWDDPTRGKHSGVVGNKIYFSVSTPNSASFVRFGKVEQIHSFVQALKERYDSEITPTSLKSIEDRLQKRKIGYGELRVVNLGRRSITSVDHDFKGIIDLCPRIEVLELNDNLFQDWGPLLQLCSGWAERLVRIDLSRNPLQCPSELDVSGYANMFSRMNGVVLGGLGYEWKQFVDLSVMWPNVDFLTVPFNRVSCLKCSSSLPYLQNLTSLDLDKNKISSWEEVCRLGGLPKLESLNLSGNQLTRICFANKDVTTLFPSLRKINISDNFIEDWLSVSELDKLVGLLDLRMDTNPVLNTYKRATNRQLIIARMQRIQKLEGVDIGRQERRDAELDYVKMFASDYAKVVEKDRFAQEHPLYFSLLQRHGGGDSVEPVCATHSMKSNKNSSFIRLIVVAESGVNGRKEIEKQIIRTMTVQKMKALLQRTFAIPRVPMKATVTSCRNPEVSFSLDNDFVEIAQYSLEDGDTLRLHW